MLSQKEIRSIVELECARLGIEDWEVVYSSGSSVSAGMVNDELTEFTSASDQTLSLRVICQGREGTAVSEKTDENTVRRLVSLAFDNCCVKEPDPAFRPAVTQPGKSYPEKNRVSSYSASAAQLKAKLKEVQTELFAADKRVSQGSGSEAAAVSSTSFTENSRGVSLSDSFSSCYISSSVIVRDKDEVKSAWLIREGDISSLSMLPVVRKALDKLHPESVSSGERKIVFCPECFNMFLSAFSSAFSGKAACLGLSPYKDKIGKPVASSAVTLIDDPLYPGYTVQKTFDGDGEATYTKEVISGGILKTLLYNRQWAQKAGTETTANAAASLSGSAISPYTFYIRPSELSLDELLALAGDGLYITSMKGFHAGANPVSGDFSIESSGFIISGGKLGPAAQGFTVAGNFFSMLENITAVADDLEFDVTLSQTRAGSPSILVSALSVAGEA